MRFVVGLAVVVCNFLSLAVAQTEFRCDTMVFCGTDEDKVGQTVTLFADRIYDIIECEPREVRIVDLPAKQIILLNSTQEVRTQISFDDLERFCQLASERVADMNELLKFASQPQFKKHWEPTGDIVSLRSPVLSYEVRTMRPPRPEIAERYRTFADWIARLTATRPPGLPAEARLEVNRTIAAQGLLPDRVTREIAAAATVHRHSSQHAYSWPLAESDRRKIAEINQSMESYKLVDFATFRAIQR